MKTHMLIGQGTVPHVDEFLPIQIRTADEELYANYISAFAK